MENTEMWNKCPRENDLLKCIVVTHGCTGQTSILKVGEGGTTYILPPNIRDNNLFFPLLSQKLGSNHPISCCIGIPSSIFVSTRSYVERISTCIH